MQLGQRERSFGIGLDGNPRDQGHMRGMDQGDRLDQGLQLIIDLEGVGGHLEHDSVGRGQMLLAPAGELGIRNALWAEDQRLLSVDPDGNEIVLVNVESNVAVGCFA